jgi:Ca-activated chloride channel homolog
VLLAFLLIALVMVEPISAAPAGVPTSGSLTILGASGGFCPLRHTDVKAGISGFVARVMVTQSFENPSPTAIEAIYTFSLPHDAAVDDMTIRIGSRTIRGVTKTLQRYLNKQSWMRGSNCAAQRFTVSQDRILECAADTDYPGESR